MSPRGRNTGAEVLRLADARDANVAWKKWGPYLSERQHPVLGERFFYADGSPQWLFSLGAGAIGQAAEVALP